MISKPKNKIIVVTGIPGSGKTTILTRALTALKTQNINYTHLSFGTEMFDIAKKEGIVNTRDQLRKIDTETQKKIQVKASKQIVKISKKTNIVFDTHATIKTPKGYLIGFPEWVVKEIRPDILVIMEATPKEIHHRRQADKSRIRDHETEEAIEEHQMMNRSATIVSGTMSGSTINIIKNRHNKINEAVHELVEVMK
ncbi:MAG: adenylate kinase [DPANN group archaeon]|nr:adenylate kinase [DPANN group archaeon]